MIFLYIGKNNRIYSSIKESPSKEKRNIMIGKLTDTGLEIKRKNIWVKQYCPYAEVTKVQGKDTYKRCGVDCPVFLEPESHVEIHASVTTINTCKRKPLIFKEFYDERE